VPSWAPESMPFSPSASKPHVMMARNLYTAGEECFVDVISQLEAEEKIRARRRQELEAEELEFRLSGRLAQKGWLENVTGFHHFTTQGHSGKVTAVAADEQLDYIATASEDGTVRIWEFEEAESKVYQLIVIVHYNDGKAVTPVTALSFVGTSTLVTATCKGDLFFLWPCNRKSQDLCKLHVHRGRIAIFWTW